MVQTDSFFSVSHVSMARGTLFALPGHELHNALNWRSVFRFSQNDLHYNYLAFQRKILLQPRHIDLAIQQAQKLRLAKPWIVFSHSAGAMLVWKWVNQLRNQLRKVDAVVCINPALKLSKYSEILTNKPLNIIYPRLRKFFLPLSGNKDYQFYSPSIHRQTLVQMKHLYQKKDKLVNVKTISGKVRVLLSSWDFYLNVKSIKQIIPPQILRSWRDYNLSYANDVLGHNPCSQTAQIFRSLVYDLKIHA